MWFNMTDEKQQVKSILLTPIECNYKCAHWKPVNIFRQNGRIYSSQKYRNALDPDMSDLAVEFYNIVYEDILKSKDTIEPKKILKEGFLENIDFAGDTMNSFNSIANGVSGAGLSAAKRTEKKEWPEFLQKYYSKYHCLANFWILPMRIGRRSGKLNRYDSVDIFLNKLKEGYSDVLKKDTEYLRKLKTYDEFCCKHFIKECEQFSTDTVLEMYRNSSDKVKSDKAKEEIVEHAYQFMELRAESISSNDEICKKLYKRFKELEILY